MMFLLEKFYGFFSVGDVTTSSCGQQSAVDLSRGNMLM